MIRVSSLLMLLVLSNPVLAQDQASTDLPTRLSAYLEPYAAAGQLSGVILVARGSEVLFERAYGMANYELSVPNTVETRFNIASITKPMTIAVVVKMIEEGKLGQEDPLSKFIPDFPKANAITVVGLLNHRAGIPHRVTTAEQETVPHTAADMVAFAKEKELTFEPGGRSSYSSAGYSVLARVVEIADGKPFSEVLQARLFDPLGMVQSADVDGRTVLPGRASSYFVVGDERVNAPLQDLSFLVGAGSVTTTARDLFRFARGVVESKLGPSVTASLMRSDGLHWNGSTSGFRAFVEYDRETDLTLVVTANQPTGVNDSIREDIPRIVAGEEVSSRELPNVTAFPISDVSVALLEGTYESRPGAQLEMVRAGDYFRIGSWFLVPTGERSLFSYQDYSPVNVRLNDEGKVDGLEWGELYMRRVE
ncbi:MAG: serine hydrolase domain-containing protein [Planctomycetota bacterium]